MACLFSSVAACGGHKPGQATPDGSMQIEVSDGSVHLNFGFDDCPQVILRVAPASARVGGHITVGATASDDDRADHLTTLWTAGDGKGTFANPTAAETTYTCPGADGAGPQSITVAVSDGKCTITRSATVSCFAVSDAGSSGGPDAATSDASSVEAGGAGGMAGSTGAGGGGGAAVVCLGDPSLCEGDQCNQCTFGVLDGQTDLCSGTKSDCFNCDATTDGCAGLTSDAERRKCYDLYVCVRDAACVNDTGDPFPCWCGTTPYGACSSGGTPANGPCVAQVVAAAGTADQAAIAARLANPNYPLGRAWNLAGCRSNFCGKRIDPDHPACARW